MGRSSRSPTPSRGTATSRISTGGASGSAFNPRSLPGADGGNPKLPPSLPAETNPHHRASLARSLSRNDAELAALNKLNVTLRLIRDEIVDKYGEGVLLDVGEGLIRLRTGDCGRENGVGVCVFNDVAGVEVGVVRVVRGMVSGSGSAGTPSAGGSPKTKQAGGIGGTEPVPDLDDNFPPDEIPLSSDPRDPLTTLLRSFLLRMKLRRRLLNRLCRRLNRVGRAMDGEDTSPPPPPKYGDMRFEADKAAVEWFMIARERREGARKRVLGRRMAERERAESGAAAVEAAGAEGVKAEPEGEAAADGGAPSDAAAAVATEAGGGERDRRYVEDLSKLIEAEPGYDKIVTYTTTSAAVGGGSGGSPGKKLSNAAASPVKAEGGADQGTEPVGEGGGEEWGDGSGGKEDAAAATAATPTKATPSSGTTSSPSKSGSSVSGTPSSKSGKSPSAKSQTNTNTIRKSVTYALAAEEPSLNSEGESTEDHVKMAYGTGIGATHRTMNSREREIEFGRWKADVLSRLPDQCTFDEIGYGNRVFGLEERRRRAAEARVGGGGGDGDDGDDGKEKEKEDMDVDEEEGEVGDEQRRQDDDDGMDVDEEGNEKGDEDHEDEEGEKKKEDEEGSPQKSDGNEEALDNADADKKDSPKPSKEKNKTTNKGPSHNKKTKLLTLALVPSFHDQDLRRTQMIQRDMMTHHMLENARGRIKDATEDYNRSFKLSTDLHNRKNRVSADLQKAQYAHRVVLNKARNDHALEVAIARAKWQKRKDAWEAERRARGAVAAAAAGYGASAVFQAQTLAQQQQQQALSSSSGGVSGVRAEVSDALTNVVDRAVVLNSARGVAVGTPVTTAASVRTDQPVTSEVASTLAHVVDAVSHRIESQSSGRTAAGVGGGGGPQGQQQQVFEPFVPPPPPRDVNAVDPATGETLAKTHERIEAQLRRDLATLTANLAVAEEDRKKSWKKMLKVKAEMEPKIASLTGQTGTAYQRRKAGGGGGGGAGYAPAAGAGSYAPPLPRGAAGGAAAAYAPTRQPPGGAYGAGAYAGTAAGRAAAAAVATANAKAAATASRGTAASSAPAASGAAGERSKYSAENIRARKASDGSIVPVTMPKKDKDGLFMRPAGRKRKGMDWDAVRGVWIPAPGALGGEDW